MGSHFKDSNGEGFDMKSLLFFVLVVHVLYGAAKDVTCKKRGKFSKTITIGSGDSYTFNTQAKKAKKYGRNVKCGVTYKRGSTCPKIMFFCYEFNINNKNSTCSGKTGDRMIIKEQGSKKSKSYCKKNSPDVSTTSKFLKVSFISNKKKRSTGAKCMVLCESDHPESDYFTTLPYPSYPDYPDYTTGNMKKCKCGITRNPTKIVGGKPTVPGNYPWMAAARWRGDLGGCGATLIASRWALTAAHCNFENCRDYPIISLTFGAHNLNDLSEKRKEVKVTKVINHPQYRVCRSHSNDIALLKLAEEVDLTSYTPACLSDSGKDYTGQVGLATGWGRTDPCIPGLHPILQEVNVRIVSDGTCEKSKGIYEKWDQDDKVCKNYTDSYAGQISDEMLCAGSQGKDTCNGDSGGPLTVEMSGQHTLVGVTSWGKGCAADGFYGVYAEVANKKLRAWIDQTIADNGGATYCSD